MKENYDFLGQKLPFEQVNDKIDKNLKGLKKDVNNVLQLCEDNLKVTEKLAAKQKTIDEFTEFGKYALSLERQVVDRKCDSFIDLIETSDYDEFVEIVEGQIQKIPHGINNVLETMNDTDSQNLDAVLASEFLKFNKYILEKTGKVLDAEIEHNSQIYNEQTENIEL